MKSPRRLKTVHDTNKVSRERPLTAKKKDEELVSSATQVEDKETWSAPKLGEEKIGSRETVTEYAEKKQRKKLERQPMSVNTVRKHKETEKRPEKSKGGKKTVGFNLRGKVNKGRAGFNSKETLNIGGLNRPRSPKWREKSLYARNYGFRPSMEVKKPSTNYLEMLKLSSQGIFDMENMRSKSSSVWVEKWVTQIRNSDDLNEENVLESLRLIQGPKLYQNVMKEQIVTDTINLPKIVVNDCSVSLIENETVEPKREQRRSKDYGSVSCLLFALECDDMYRDFPKFTLLEIADCLSESTDIDQIEFIQRRRKRWEIVVRGDEVKEKLLNHGLVVRGRWYAFVEDPFFKEYYTKETLASDSCGESVEIWRQPRSASLVD